MSGDEILQKSNVRKEEGKRQLETDRLIQDVERNHTKYAEEVLERVLKI